MLKLDTIWTQYKEMADVRMKICQECEQYEESFSRCNVCGCYMKIKVQWPSSQCPLNKWTSHQENKDG